MLRNLIALTLFFTTTIPSVAAGSFSEWKIDTENSKLFYISTKREHVAERHALMGISGKITDEGALEVKLDMNSIDSGITVRDNRIKENVFDVERFPEAGFSSELDMSEFQELAVGESTVGYVDGELTLVGIQGFLDFDVLVTRIAENRVSVTSFGPIVLNSGDFELMSGIDKLRDLADLPSISYAVPVTFHLSFVSN